MGGGPNVLMIGVGYFPRRTAGDKNFFVDLVSNLHDRLSGLTVLSVNDGPPGESAQETARGCVRILNVRRPLHRGDPGRYFHSAGGTWSYHHMHHPAQEAIERYLTLFVLRRRLAALVQSDRVEVVHFMDNFGPAMPWLRRELAGPAVTATALRYDPRGRLYRSYLRASFRPLDGVACLTDVYRAILRDLGVRGEGLATLRWGPAPGFAVDAGRRAAVDARYGLAPGSPLFVWAGFIQQVAADSLAATAALARALVATEPALHVVFAFKPESWRDEFRVLAGERIHLEVGAADFPALLARADCLLSPVVRMSSTVAPPLTWIEAMTLGTPIATTAARGVGEVLIDGENAIVAPSAAALEMPLRELLGDRPRLAALGARARAWAQERFDMQAIAAGYAEFLAGAAARRTGRRAPAPGGR